MLIVQMLQEKSQRAVLGDNYAKYKNKTLKWHNIILPSCKMVSVKLQLRNMFFLLTTLILLLLVESGCSLTFNLTKHRSAPYETFSLHCTIQVDPGEKIEHSELIYNGKKIMCSRHHLNIKDGATFDITTTNEGQEIIKSVPRFVHQNVGDQSSHVKLVEAVSGRQAANNRDTVRYDTCTSGQLAGAVLGTMLVTLLVVAGGLWLIYRYFNERIAPYFIQSIETKPNRCQDNLYAPSNYLQMDPPKESPTRVTVKEQSKSARGVPDTMGNYDTLPPPKPCHNSHDAAKQEPGEDYDYIPLNSPTTNALQYENVTLTRGQPSMESAKDSYTTTKV